MPKFFDELISKVLWTMLGFGLLVAGYNYLVSNLIKPPKLNSTQTQFQPTNQNVIPAIHHPIILNNIILNLYH